MAEIDDSTDTLPENVAERADRLTRLARDAVDENERDAYLEERAELLAEHGFAARLREDDTSETLVLHPEEWLEDGVVQIERIDDTDRAVERSLSGVGDAADWDAIEAHNRAIAERVREEHGEAHGETAHDFADFMSNHYAKRIEAATPAEKREFRTEYFPRNAWPTDEQLEVVEQSLRLIENAAE
ncbi:MAG: hypothetical protein ACI8UR_000397 [Natronomonas sp.]|jgi:hypothetical protein|uniref:DUF7108 family protein n=1 Tax=Natronomonas sp. TaxID=2184060 RepID=UPI003988E8D7